MCPTVIYLYWEDARRKKSFVETALTLLESEKIPVIADRDWKTAVPESEKHVHELEQSYGRSIHGLIRRYGKSGRIYIDTISRKYNLTSDEVVFYLREMSLPVRKREPLLLSDFWENPSNFPKALPLRQILVFFRTHRAGSREAIEYLTSHHLRLPAGMGWQTKESWGWDRNDATQEGFLGLHKAAKHYRPTRKATFGSYAVWGVRQAIQRARFVWKRNSGEETYRLSGTFLWEVRNYISIFPHLHHRFPRPTDIAEKFELTVNQARQLLEPKLSATTPTELRRLLGNIPEPSSKVEEESVAGEDLASRINEWLLILHPRSREIIKLRYGLLDGHARTLAEVAPIYKLTRERIRQIEEKAIKKLRRRFRQEGVLLGFF